MKKIVKMLIRIPVTNQEKKKIINFQVQKI